MSDSAGKNVGDREATAIGIGGMAPVSPFSQTAISSVEQLWIPLHDGIGPSS